MKAGAKRAAREQFHYGRLNMPRHGHTVSRRNRLTPHFAASAIPILPVPFPTFFLVLILIVRHEDLRAFKVAHEFQPIPGIGIVLDTVV